MWTLLAALVGWQAAVARRVQLADLASSQQKLADSMVFAWEHSAQLAVWIAWRGLAIQNVAIPVPEAEAVKYCTACQKYCLK